MWGSLQRHFILCSIGYCWFPFFLWRAWTRKGAALLSLIPVLGYGLVSGMSPSTQRAVIMIVIFLMTFLIRTKHESLNFAGHGGQS